MKNLVLIAIALLAVNHFSQIDLTSIVHLKDYAVSLLVALMVQPWVVGQLDG